MLVRRFRRNYIIANLCALISSLAILCVPFVDLPYFVSSKWFMYTVGAVFWLGVVFEQIFFWLANADRKDIERRLRRMKAQTFKNTPIGILSFFKNTEAMCTDLVLFSSALSVALISLFKYRSTWIIIACVALMFFSFNLHCFLNGKNYKYIKLFSKQKKEQE